MLHMWEKATTATTTELTVNGVSCWHDVRLFFFHFYSIYRTKTVFVSLYFSVRVCISVCFSPQTHTCTLFSLLVARNFDVCESSPESKWIRAILVSASGNNHNLFGFRLLNGNSIGMEKHENWWTPVLHDTLKPPIRSGGRCLRYTHRHRQRLTLTVSRPIHDTCTVHQPKNLWRKTSSTKIARYYGQNNENEWI